MTFLEKAKEKYPKAKESTILKECPEAFGLETESICKDGCIECWNREMPDTELGEYVILPAPPNTDMKVAITKDDLKLEYNKGLNDAWEFTKELYDYLQEEDVQDLFGVKYGLREVLGKYTYAEAFEILKEYKEKNTIKVGDVIRKKAHETFLVVTHCGKQVFEGIDEDGNIHSHTFEGYEKTGKHLDVKSLLEQIGE